MFRKFFMAVPIVAVAIGGSTACATKKFVRTNFLVAQAVEPPMASTAIGTATRNFGNIIDPP